MALVIRMYTQDVQFVIGIDVTENQHVTLLFNTLTAAVILLCQRLSSYRNMPFDYL